MTRLAKFSIEPSQMKMTDPKSIGPNAVNLPAGMDSSVFVEVNSRKNERWVSRNHDYFVQAALVADHVFGRMYATDEGYRAMNARNN
jgi:hypothetical protein